MTLSFKINSNDNCFFNHTLNLIELDDLNMAIEAKTKEFESYMNQFRTLPKLPSRPIISNPDLSVVADQFIKIANVHNKYNLIKNELEKISRFKFLIGRTLTAQYQGASDPEIKQKISTIMTKATNNLCLTFILLSRVFIARGEEGKEMVQDKGIWKFIAQGEGGKELVQDKGLWAKAYIANANI